MASSKPTRAAFIKCARFCDSTLARIDGNPRDVVLVAKRHGRTSAQCTSNMKPLEAAEMLIRAADKLIDAHARAGGR